MKNSNSLESFKRKLESNRKKPPAYYYHAHNRKSQIPQTRLRLGCSHLNHDLVQNYVRESPYCPCGAIETTSHFLFECHNYVEPRSASLMSLPNVVISESTLLYGSHELNYDENKSIFEATQTYILKTNRFP